jgi:hypothetical protein
MLEGYGGQRFEVPLTLPRMLSTAGHCQRREPAEIWPPFSTRSDTGLKVGFKAQTVKAA